MRTILGYRDGRAIWSENTPAEHVRLFGLGGSYRIGGRSIVDAAPFVAPAVRAPKEPRDYQDSAAKGWTTRKLRGENLR